LTEPAKDSKKEDRAYRVKGVPINAYIDEAGEFHWVPESCTDEESVRETLGVLKKMPHDRRQVWGTRLDREETLARCPVIKSKPELSKEFDEFYAAYDQNKRKPKQTAEPRNGGENTK
jgi:secreted PhoX family phosphatase